MQAVQGELVIILTSEEAEALTRALAKAVETQETADAKALRAIQQKLRTAREKML